MTTCFFTGSSYRSSWASYQPSAKERGPDAYKRSSASLNSSTGPVRETQDLRRDKGLAGVSHSRLLNQPGEPSSVDATPASSPMLRSCFRNNHENPLKRQDKDVIMDSLPNSGAQDHRHVQSNKQSCSKEKESTSINTETGTRQNHRDEIGSRKGMKSSGKESTSKENDTSDHSQSKKDRNKSTGEQKEIEKSSCGSINGQHQQHEDPPHNSSSKPNSSRSNTNIQRRKEEFRHKQGQERQSRHTEMSGGRSEKSSSDRSHRKTEKRETRQHHRKEEKRQESMSSLERRHIRSEGINNCEHNKSRGEERSRTEEKNSNRGERRSTRSETSKEHESQAARDLDTTKGVGNKADKLCRNDGKDRNCTDARQTRRLASPVKPHRSAQNLRKDQEDKRRTSGRTEESSRCKASSTCDDYVHGAKQSMKGRSEKHTDTLAKGSKNASDNASEGVYVQVDGLANPSRKSPARLTSGCDGAATVEESSPKRKLSFMETLNLTASPVKKQSVSERANESVQLAPEDTLVIESTKDSSLFEVGEEFCVVDEVDGSLCDSMVHPTGVTTQQCDPATSLEGKGKELELPKRCDDDPSETLSGEICGTDSEMQEDDFVKSDILPARASEKCIVNKTAIPEVSLLPESADPVDSTSVPLTNVGCKEQDSQDSVKKDERRKSVAKNSSEESKMDDKPEVQNNTSQQEVDTSVMVTATTEASPNMDPAVSLDVVSSTVGVENNHKSKETVSVSDSEITQGHENPDLCPGPLVGPSGEENNSNITAQEERKPTEQARSSEPDSTENVMESSRLSQSVVVLHDEESMMLTLSNIRVIPEAISPLTSPVRQTKKSQQQQRLGKETHVKSLSKGQCTMGFFLLWF